ncbi:MAG: AbrB/MazE/SpoVT family DNA-binding domain-containing protein [Candidatus Woesebacteria bacterium]|nr:AbrB/MazE/SpoVT family DNA-binding domain-containing protein [Candidatus Woesebacteria bacterium]
MPTKIQKWGNSLAMRLPKEMADKLDLREGSEIEIIHKSKNIVIMPVRIRRKKEKLPTLNELASRITKNNKHSLIGWVSPIGKEIW